MILVSIHANAYNLRRCLPSKVLNIGVCIFKFKKRYIKYIISLDIKYLLLIFAE